MKKTEINNRSIIIKWFRNLIPLFISLAVFFILIIGITSYSNHRKDLWENDVRTRIYEILSSKKNKLEKALYSRVYYTKSVAAYVSLRPNVSNPEFYNLAQELINNDSVISTMSLSKNGILNAIYPLQGHESAIGLNLFEHPERKEIVYKTIETKKTFIAGPVELVEGGVAFISYTPIFDKITHKEHPFWGVTDIVIYQDKLLEQASLKTIESGFLFALRGVNGTGNNGQIWWGDEKVFTQNPVVVSVNLPYGTWALGAIPVIGWESYLNHDRILLAVLIASSTIISLLIWIISRALIKIRQNEQELNAIIHSMDSLIIEFNKEGRYIKIPHERCDLLVKPREELLNKTVYDVFPIEDAEMFHRSILKCLQTQKLQVIEYRIQINGETKWFAARISWKTPESVIYHAYDITEQKLARENIIQSEKRLKKLNATKDKLFSFVAHDLKSPLMVVLGYIDLLKSNYENIDETERKEFLDNIDESAKKTTHLLENLFLWANSQRDEIKIVKEHLNLKETIHEAIEGYQSGALVKSINVNVNVNEELNVNADAAALKTIVGNLFNNAIKFTPENGTVTIEAFYKKEFVKVCISDTGVGVNSNDLNKLFTDEENFSTPGTNNEKGTGLGLFICKEFVQKHNGEIWVDSEEGKGSKFYFTIPVDSTT